MEFVYHFVISIWFYLAQHNDEAKREGAGSRATKAFEHENTKSTSNFAITEKTEKQYVRLQLRILETQGAYSNKVAPDIDCFTKEAVVQCDLEVVKNAFVDDSN